MAALVVVACWCYMKQAWLSCGAAALLLMFLAALFFFEGVCCEEGKGCVCGCVLYFMCRVLSKKIRTRKGEGVEESTKV